MEFRPTNLIPVDLTSANPTSILIPGYLTPPQIAKAYGLPAATGKGIKIGILSFGGGFLQSDLDKSFADLVAGGWFPAGTKAPTIKQVLLDGQTGTFSISDGVSGENTVDIYCTATIVPEADITLYIGGSWNTIFNRAVADGCHFISVSWATTEGAWPWVESALTNATANKVTVLSII
jgi:subtilase family serine protease